MQIWCQGGERRLQGKKRRKGSDSGKDEERGDHKEVGKKFLIAFQFF